MAKAPVPTLHYLCRKTGPMEFARYAFPFNDNDFERIALLGIPVGWTAVHIPLEELRKGSKRKQMLFARKILRRGLRLSDPIADLILYDRRVYGVLKQKPL